MTPRDSILIVLGMHRSGTSFLTDCTEVLGFTLPGDRNGASSDNPKGHFEPRAIVDLNDAVLAREGAIWARIAPVGEAVGVGMDGPPHPASSAAPPTASAEPRTISCRRERAVIVRLP